MNTISNKLPKAKVLLIYPTLHKVTGLHVGLATLSAVLKKNGHEVKIFDTAFYEDMGRENQAKIRAERGMSKKIDDENKYLPDNDSNLEEDLIDVIKDYNPDLIGISILELVFDISLRLAKLIKKNFKEIPIIAGGVFPSLSPERVINEDSIDIVCIGEGETALLELTNRISKKGIFVDIDGLWVKNNYGVHKNGLAKLHDINKLPYPDYSGFDKRLFYKPMQGKVRKMVNITTSRGCCFNCSFCAAPRLTKLFKENDCGTYSRRMHPNNIINQINLQIDKHDPEFIYFSSESFLSMTDRQFDLFVESYKDINIPFWIQTRIETITKERLLRLKNVGMYWLTIGLEHGNEEFRKRVLKRNYSNKMFIEKMGILKELNIGASLNNMLGFPFETRELIFDTIKMNRELIMRDPKLESNVFLFTPFRGCELFDVCKEKAMIDDGLTSSSMLGERSVINFSEEFQEDLKGLIRTFNLYVRLPEKYYEKIRIAEKSNKKGNIALKKLSKLLNK